MRDKIVEASIEALRNEGLKFSVDTLADSLRISKKTVYKFFPDNPNDSPKGRMFGLFSYGRGDKIQNLALRQSFVMVHRRWSAKRSNVSQLRSTKREASIENQKRKDEPSFFDFGRGDKIQNLALRQSFVMVHRRWSAKRSNASV